MTSALSSSKGGRFSGLSHNQHQKGSQRRHGEQTQTNEWREEEKVEEEVVEEEEEVLGSR